MANATKLQHPLQTLMAAMHRGPKNDDHLAEIAAQLGPPPPENYRPGGMPMAGVQRPMPMPTSPLVAGQKAPTYVPPMTQGEYRTTPRLGATLLG